MDALKSIEEKLIHYFNKDKKIYVLNKKLEVLKKQISEIDYKLQNIDVNLPDESLSIRYEDKIQTSRSECGYAEKAMIKITDRLLDERAWKKEEIADIEKVLRAMESDSVTIDDKLSSIDPEDQEFLKQKYRYGKKDWQLGMIFNMSQSAATKRKNKLLKNIMDEFYISTP